MKSIHRPFDPSQIPVPRGCIPWTYPLGFADLPLDLEIGCGVGWHPIRYAFAHPDRYLIAIERTREKFEKFARRVAKHGDPSNLSAVHADAIGWITHALPAQSLSRIFLLYPNPESGNPAQRWLRMPFFSHLMSKLGAGGEIILVTNREAYFREARSWATESWGLDVRSERAFSLADLGASPQFRTHFEKKYLSRGEVCFELRLRSPVC